MLALRQRSWRMAGRRNQGIPGRESTRDRGKVDGIQMGVVIFSIREAIQEDIEGHLIAPDDELLYKSKRRK